MQWTGSASASSCASRAADERLRLRNRRVPALWRVARWTSASAVVAASLLVSLAAAPAGAASLPANLAKFANCPVNNPAVSVCLYSATSDTTFVIGSTTVTTTAPTQLSLGLKFNAKGQPSVVLPDNGTQALAAPATPLPGGLLGIPGAPDSGDLAVTATPQLVGTPVVSLGNLLTRNGPGITLPIDVLVSNSLGLLGSDCTIADAADPITLNLTTGTTDPPPPNTPVSGAIGSVTSNNKGIVSITGLTLVDNAFAVPGADNCGNGGILDEVLDLDKSLPSAAGNNSATLSGSSFTAPATLIRKYLG
jgi:hypothetical protein